MIAQPIITTLNNDLTQADIDQIVARWVKDQQIQAIPRKAHQRHVIFRWLSQKFECDYRYDEDQVFEIAAACCVPGLATELISLTTNAHYLDRTIDNTWYWRPDSPLAQAEDFDPKQLPIAQEPDPLKYTATRETLRKRDPNGDYAHLRSKVIVPNLDRERKIIALRLKNNQHYTAAELDVHILKYRRIIVDDPATIRADMVREGLLHQIEGGLYSR